MNFTNFNPLISQQQSQIAVVISDLLLINNRNFAVVHIGHFQGVSMYSKLIFHYALVYIFLLGDKVSQHTANCFPQQ